MRIYSNSAPVQKYGWIFNFYLYGHVHAPWYLWKLVETAHKKINVCCVSQYVGAVLLKFDKYDDRMISTMLHAEPRVSSSNTRYSGAAVAKCTSTGSWSVIPGPDLFCWKHNLQNQNYIYFVNKHTVSPDLPRFSDISSDRACVSICSICK